MKTYIIKLCTSTHHTHIYTYKGTFAECMIRSQHYKDKLKGVIRTVILEKETNNIISIQSFNTNYENITV